MTEVGWDDHLAQLEFFVKSPMLLGRAVLPAMRARRFGRIVQIDSEVVDRPPPGRSAYATAKSAQIGLTRSWARELAPLGITVNTVAPGFIPVERHADVTDRDARPPTSLPCPPGAWERPTTSPTPSASSPPRVPASSPASASSSTAADTFAAETTPRAVRIILARRGSIRLICACTSPTATASLHPHGITEARLRGAHDLEADPFVEALGRPGNNLESKSAGGAGTFARVFDQPAPRPRCICAGSTNSPSSSSVPSSVGSPPRIPTAPRRFQPPRRPSRR